jgi:hypothetical protein
MLGEVAGRDKILDGVVKAGKWELVNDGDSANAKPTCGPILTKYYSKVAKKHQANPNYINKELARLEGLLSKDMDESKRDGVKRRVNVLRVFKEQLDEGGSGKEEL